MSKRFALSLAGICLMLISLNAFARVEGSANSAVGTWRLDAARSSFGNMPAPKFEQLVVSTDQPDALKWNIKGATADGKSYISSYDGPVDGKEHPMMDSSGPEKIAYTRTSAGVQWVAKDSQGNVVETAAGILSPDGKTLTIKGSRTGPKGKSNFISVFTRAQ